MPREPGWWYRPPGLTARALGPLAHIYGVIAARRLKHGTPYRSPLPVVCVGNFTAGGSGKTPFGVMLAQNLIARGERPAFLTRGFGGRERGPHWVDVARDSADAVGDEPLLLARVAPVMVSRDRPNGARAIEARGDATVIVMDDGLQNPALAKDLSLAVIDAARGFGNGRVIPSGPLRLPLGDQATLVHAVVFNGEARPDFAAELAQLVPVPQLRALLEGDRLEAGRYVAYAGIGHPARFFATARSLGATLVETVSFPDHARYTGADADRLLGLAQMHNARLITTEKDHVRLTGSVRLDALAAASAVLPVRMVLDPPSIAALSAMLERM